MILKSIYLKNFKKFEELYISFTSELSNKTIIFGANGAGKTTILYAIFLCVCSDFRFKEKELLNDLCKKCMTLNEIKEAKVILEIEYRGKSYKIEYIQKYKKINNYRIEVIEKKHNLIFLSDDLNEELNEIYNYESFYSEVRKYGILDFDINKRYLLGYNEKILRKLSLLNLSKEDTKNVLIDIVKRTLIIFLNSCSYGKRAISNAQNYKVKINKYGIGLYLNIDNKYEPAYLATGPQTALQVSFLLAIHDCFQAKINEVKFINFPILADDLFDRLPTEDINIVFESLINRKGQVIMFENSYTENYLATKSRVNMIYI